MGFKCLILSLFLGFVAPAVASTVFDDDWSPPQPDAGKKMRTVCYKSESGGDRASADKDFVVIIEQAEDSFYDASYFIPGNYNYTRKHVTSNDSFNVYVYPTVQKTMGVDISGIESRELARRILKKEPGWHYKNVWGGRSLKSLKISLPEGHVIYDRQYKQNTQILDGEREPTVWISLYCEESYSLEIQKPEN